ncbi:MAG: cation:dicarboxylase symporter family transporter [Gemmatimonadaceae bacterium]|nr:cation:dicarboxylase symporter family transporter [Gemmatimonadaceae bacterium]
MIRSQSLRVLLALAIGLALGMTVETMGDARFAQLVPIADVVGTLWTNAIRMTVIPLVVALTIASVASGGATADLRRAMARAIAVFLVLLIGGGLLALVIGELAFANFTLPADVAARIRDTAAAAGSTPNLPTLGQRLVEMIPSNPVKAAADGALLPLVVFSLALGFALKRIAADRRAAVITLCRGISDALLVVVGWVVAAAPIGVFALAFALGARLGIASVGALARYIATLSVVLITFTLALYPVVVLFGRVPFRRFLAAAAPAQALAAGSRSSLSALPMMISAAREKLRLDATASGFVLPFAVSIFRVNVPMAWVVGVIFLGKLYGVEIGVVTLLTVIVTSTLLSFSVPGIPSGSLFILAPVLVDLGLPAEAVGILIAVDVVPDIFKTTANVTAHLTAAVLASGAPTLAAAHTADDGDVAPSA